MLHEHLTVNVHYMVHLSLSSDRAASVAAERPEKSGEKGPST